MTITPSGHTVLRAGIAAITIETIAVLLRLRARRTCKGALAVDDWFVIASLLPSYGMFVIGGLLVTKGRAGEHTADLSASELTIFLQLTLAGMVTYALTITMVKLSILLLYRRLFATEDFRRVTTFSIGLCVVWFLTTFFGNLFRCHPVHTAWDPNLAQHCVNLQAFYYGVASSNLVIDVGVLALPVYMVWQLQLQRKDKWALSGIFLLGIFSCVAGLLVIVTAGDANSDDIVYTSTTSYMFSSIEPSAAIICACLTTYRPLLTALNARFSAISFSRSRSDPPTSTKVEFGRMASPLSVAKSARITSMALSSNLPIQPEGLGGSLPRRGAGSFQVSVRPAGCGSSNQIISSTIRWHGRDDEKPPPVTPIDEESFFDL